jgi:hypothetical protein
MSTQPVERHVRICPAHKVAVEEHGSSLVCPRGWHAVSHFKVLDRLQGRVTDVPVDGDEERGGITVEDKTRPQGLEARPKEATAMAVVAGRRKEPKRMVIAKAKFQDAAAATLWIRLIRQRTAKHGEVFVVRWARHEAGKKTAAKTAPLAAENAQEKARDAFVAAVAEARQNGWRDRAVIARELTFLPLPKAAVMRKGK